MNEKRTIERKREEDVDDDKKNFFFSLSIGCFRPISVCLSVCLLPDDTGIGRQLYSDVVAAAAAADARTLP